MKVCAQGTIAPSPFQTTFNNSGTIVTNSCIWTYTAGTSTPASTFTDSALTTPNTNPIRSDSAGRFTAFLAPGSSYKFVFETSCVPPAHGTTLRTADNIAATPSSSVGVDVLGTAGEAISANQCVYLSDGSGSKTSGQWFKCDSTNTYSSTLLPVGLATAAISTGNTGTIRIAGSVTGFSSLTVGAAYFASTAGTVTTTAPVNRRFLGVADTTTSIVLTGNPPLQTAAPAWTVITTTATGTVNDWAPATVTGNTEIRCNNASLLTVQGIAAGYDGQIVRLVSVGAGQVDLAHQNAGSTAANRLINVATSASTSLAAGSGVADYQYDATTTRWRLIAHVQGAPISWTPIFGGGTSESGQVYTTQIGKYVLVGTVLHVQGNLTLSTLGTITGNVRIKGLPFTIITGGAANYGGLQINYFSALTTSVVWLSAFAVINTTTCELTKLTAAATGISNVVQADLSATTSMFFGGTLAVQ